MARHPQRDNDQLSEQETEQRFQRLVRAALNTKPKPLKTMGPKGVPAQSKKRQRTIKHART
jgi:spore germination protein GerM